MKRQVTITPLSIALKSQIPRGQKLALAGIFSLSLLITIFSIIRFIFNSPSRRAGGSSWIQAWSSIEQSVSVAVACLASFRIYVIDKRRKSQRSPARSREKEKSSPNSHKFRLPSAPRLGLSDLRIYSGNPSTQRDDSGSMELQLLNATPLSTPAQVKPSKKHEDNPSVFQEVH